jgi:SnoaL-like domain
MMTLEERLQRLEDDRAIRDLKARYLRACDSQDPDALADCLLADVRVRFEGFPPFDNRDDFVAVYRQFGCAPGIHDIHHAANGVIAFDHAERARAQWALSFHNIDLAQRRLTQFGIEYDDVYVKREGRWWIAETASRRKSVLVQVVDENGQTRVTAMGQTDAEFGKVAAND